MDARLTTFYNTTIAIPQRKPTILSITKDALVLIFNGMTHFTLFEDNNHFVTHDHHFVTKKNGVHYRLCTQSSTYVHAQDQLMKPPVTVPGQTHFTLDRLIVDHTVQVTSLWCAKCRKRLFDWYIRKKCIKCYTIDGIRIV